MTQCLDGGKHAQHAQHAGCKLLPFERARHSQQRIVALLKCLDLHLDAHGSSQQCLTAGQRTP